LQGKAPKEIHAILTETLVCFLSGGAKDLSAPLYLHFAIDVNAENMVLRRIFGLRRDEVTGEWRRMHNEELNVLCCSPNIVRVIKSRRMRWAGHVARMGEERGV